MKSKTTILNDIILANNKLTLQLVKDIKDLESKIESNSIDIQYLKYVLAGFKIIISKLKNK